MPRQSLAPRCLSVVIVFGLIACQQQPRQKHGMNELSDGLEISVPESVSSRLAQTSVRLVGARPVLFAAFVEADRDHSEPVVASEAGEVRVLSLLQASPVRLGDSIGVLHSIHGGESNTVLRAPAVGRWRPGKHPGEVVWPGDTIGIVQLPGWFLAVGTVSDAGTIPVHVGDSAVVVFDGADQRPVRATVAKAVQDGFGSAEVTLHYSANQDATVFSRPAQATVFPRESLLVVPAEGLGNSSYGPIVFLPMEDGKFQVRLVSVDPHSSLGIVVHRGLTPPATVATGDLRLLQAVAEESLRVATSRP